MDKFLLNLIIINIIFQMQDDGDSKLYYIKNFNFIDKNFL